MRGNEMPTIQNMNANNSMYQRQNSLNYNQNNAAPANQNNFQQFQQGQNQNSQQNEPFPAFQTQFQARGGMTPAMNRPVFNKQPVGYVGAPNSMSTFVNQPRNVYNMGQQQMPGKY